MCAIELHVEGGCKNKMFEGDLQNETKSISKISLQPQNQYA